MARTKTDYGIDLGTTNSAIARMQNGEPTIIKSEGFGMDTTPSCVWFNKKGTSFVGTKSFNNLGSESIAAFAENDPSLINAFEEFKRTMGTDIEYECKKMGKAFSSEELSAEVLKALKGYIRDEEVNAIVITVPAKFQGYQKDATMKAAELAGFQHCILLQEPIAASTAYGIDAQTVDGDWLVFDFGGGTFDVALMRANEGIMKVVDTEGDNRLGGKNVDYAIVDEIIIPYLEETYSICQILADEGRKNLLRNAVKQFAEEIKINLSLKDKNHFNTVEGPLGEDDEGKVISIDLTVTKEKYEEVVKPIFQRAIDISQKLLKKNKLSGSDLTTVLMIGGPTLSETFRDMVRDQITPNVNVSIDPMTAVARGAALFASTKSIPDGIQEADKSKIQLKLIYQTDTVETKEKIGIKVLRDKTEGEIPEKLYVELYRQDKGWSSGKVEIKDDAEILEIPLEPGKSNGFTITITDEKGTVFPSEPDSFSIIQGFKVAGPTLPFDLCIDALEISVGKQHLICIELLKKNQPLPAKGPGVFQTQKNIRPGNKSDQIRIPVFYGEKGTRGIYNDLRGEVIITGEQLPGMLPKGSDVELTFEVDDSEMIKVSASFPYLDDEIIENVIKCDKRKMVSKEYLERELNKAISSLEYLEEEYPELDLLEVEEIRDGLNELETRLDRGGSDADTPNQVLDRLRESLKEIDRLESSGEWPKAVLELTEALERLENINEQHGNDKTAQIVKKCNREAKTIIEKQDLKTAKDLTEQIHSICFAIIEGDVGKLPILISLLKGFDDNFDMHEWKNRSRARQLINEAKGIINANRATESNLGPIIGQLFELLPQAQQRLGGKLDDDVLLK